MRQWEHLFSQNILKEGLSLYKKGCVEDIQVSKYLIKGEVEDQDESEFVQINLEKGYPVTFDCTCDKEEILCVHEAAVLYAYEESLNKRLTPQELVDQLNIEKIKQVLVHLIENDDFLYEQLEFDYKIEQGNLSLDDYIFEMDRIIDTFVDQNNYVSCQEVHKYVDALSNYIQDYLVSLVNNNQGLMAFSLSQDLLDRFLDVDLEYGYDYDTICSKVYDLWNLIIKNVSKQDKQEIFVDLFDSSDNEYYDCFMLDYHIQFLINHFTEKKYQRYIIPYLDKHLKHIQEKRGKQSENYEKYIVYEMIYSEQIKNNHWLNQLVRENFHFSKVRSAYIDLLIKHKEYDDALAIIDDALELEKDTSLIEKYHETMKMIYSKLKDKENYDKELYDLVTKYGKNNYKYYHELKQQYKKAEWVEKRKEILNQIKDTNKIDQLYEEEKMYPELLHYVLENDDIDKLIDHLPVLNEHYPKEILVRYEQEMDEMATPAKGREYYQYLMNLLEKIIYLPGGKDTVKDIVEKWHKQYSNRSAMMEELRYFERKHDI